MFRGSFVAIVTPFKDNKIDKVAFKGLIEFHIAQGTKGIVPCGTTGESATLSYSEHNELIEYTVKIVNKRVPVIAGTGSNSTAEAVRLTQYAKDVGADGALLISPYYNKPTQEGIFQHYKYIAQAVDIPIILYNVPGRTSSNILPETVAKLAELDNIVAIKEASGNLQQITDIIAICGEKISVISGDDPLFLPILSIGGKGIISVTANILPSYVSNLYNCFINGKYEEALDLHYKLRKINSAMFAETSPIPVKTALHLMNKISDEIRLPLCKISDSSLNRLKIVLSEYELI